METKNNEDAHESGDIEPSFDWLRPERMVTNGEPRVSQAPTKLPNDLVVAVEDDPQNAGSLNSLSSVSECTFETLRAGEEQSQSYVSNLRAIRKEISKHPEIAQAVAKKFDEENLQIPPEIERDTSNTKQEVFPFEQVQNSVPRRSVALQLFSWLLTLLTKATRRSPADPGVSQTKMTTVSQTQKTGSTTSTALASSENNDTLMTPKERGGGKMFQCITAEAPAAQMSDETVVTLRAIRTTIEKKPDLARLISQKLGPPDNEMTDSDEADGSDVVQNIRSIRSYMEHQPALALVVSQRFGDASN